MQFDLRFDLKKILSQTWKSKSVRKILNRTSVVTATISVSCFRRVLYVSVHSIKIGHGIIIEDLGFDLRFACGRFEISKKIGI